ncbi:MAG: 1-acyl-sn-glycerol-3-phosphate acyltransferase [Syntrophobacterales bacterium]
MSLSQGKPQTPSPSTPEDDKPKGWLSRLINRLTGWLGGHEFHYAGYLPSRPSFLLRYTLDPSFAKVTVNPKIKDRLQELSRQGVVVYALKYRSTLDFLFFNRRYQKLGAPTPEVAFDLNLWIFQPFSHLVQIISAALNYFTRKRAWPNPFRDGYFLRILREKRSALLFLVDQVGFRHRFLKPREDPLRHLLEIQEQLDFPIFLVPQIVMYSQDPTREDKGLLDLFFGDRENPGRLRKLGLCLRKSKKAVVEVADPVNLKELLADSRLQADPVLKAQDLRQELIQRLDQKRRLVTGPLVKTREELMEITLTDPGLTGFMERLAETEKKKLPKIKKTAQDYFWEMAADFNMVVVPFMNRIVRWLSRTLFEDVSFDREGFEKVREAGQRGNLIFIPCHKSHIDYLLLNNLMYQHYLHPPRIAAGKNLAFWPLGPLFRGSGAFFIRRRFLGGKLYAEVLYHYIKTLIKTGYSLEGEPISLNNFLAQQSLNGMDETEKIRTVSNELAFQVVEAINRISVVTPFALVCAALLTYPRKGVYRRELLKIIQVLYDYLKARNVPMADSLENLNQAVEETLALCEVRKLITPIEEEEGLSDELGLGGYSIDETKRPLLEYYKNNIIHFFLPAAMVSLATLSGTGFEVERRQVLEDVRFLDDFFKYEFFFNGLDPEALVNETLGYFTSREVVVSLDGGDNRYTLSASGLKELAYFANLLYNYLESYYIVFRSIKYLQKKPRSEKEFLKRINSIGNKSYKLGEVERSEALSEANFQNALKIFGEKGIVIKKRPEGKGATTFSPPADEDAKDFYGRQLARFLRR